MEIERKFLVKNTDFIQEAYKVCHIKQGYLAVTDKSTTRVRTLDDRAYITIKSKSFDNGLSREEWEYDIPIKEALQLLELCRYNIIEKYRYLVKHEGYVWEVDKFIYPIENLTIAEIELPQKDIQFTLPKWVSEEVTGKKEYYNSFISRITEL